MVEVDEVYEIGVPAAIVGILADRLRSSRSSEILRQLSCKGAIRRLDDTIADVEGALGIFT